MLIPYAGRQLPACKMGAYESSHTRGCEASSAPVTLSRYHSPPADEPLFKLCEAGAPLGHLTLPTCGSVALALRAGVPGWPVLSPHPQPQAWVGQASSDGDVREVVAAGGASAPGSSCFAATNAFLCGGGPFPVFRAGFCIGSRDQEARPQVLLGRGLQCHLHY